MAYVQVNREKLEHFLQACGFSRRVVGGELVYMRENHHYSSIVVKVWTSLPKDGGDARGKGQDAIRVTVAYESQIPFKGRTSFGLYKTTRIFRTGSEEAILDRLYERMREAYAFSNDWLRRHWAELPKKA
jgi:hypothetical protein